MSADDTWLSLKDGSLYLDHATCDRFFAGLDTIILLRRDDDLLILPVRHAAAGGYLLKRRNAAGDRVVTAPDFFRHHGLEAEALQQLGVTWAEDKGALVSKRAFCLPT